MSKTKRKTHKEVEFLRGLVRKLRADLRKCKKGHPEHIKDEADVPEEENPIICDECGKGELSILDLGRAIYTRCLLCGIRKKI